MIVKEKRSIQTKQKETRENIFLVDSPPFSHSKFTLSKLKADIAGCRKMWYIYSMGKP